MDEMAFLFISVYKSKGFGQPHSGNLLLLQTYNYLIKVYLLSARTSVTNGSSHPLSKSHLVLDIQIVAICTESPSNYRNPPRYARSLQKWSQEILRASHAVRRYFQAQPSSSAAQSWSSSALLRISLTATEKIKARGYIEGHLLSSRQSLCPEFVHLLDPLQEQLILTLLVRMTLVCTLPWCIESCLPAFVQGDQQMPAVVPGSQAQARILHLLLSCDHNLLSGHSCLGICAVLYFTPFVLSRKFRLQNEKRPSLRAYVAEPLQSDASLQP
eukprot:TRINITY_DN26851_c0_g1_i1.p1 TRINITY_DN26851_c0_g1~~TRINITY_DN26851_c0_g1_i1.p1  ORF type:complete len:271 (-),score=-14.88 TRINITY_DN26851_c0_g1_i1:56-868(-)